MTWQSETRAWAVASAAAFCLGTIGYRVVTAPALPDLAPTVTSINSTLGIINHPCAPGPCGTLGNIDKLVVKVGDIAVDTQKQVRQSGKLIDAASQSLTSTSDHLNAAVDTLNAQLTHVSPVLDAARDAAASVAPIVANTNGAVSDVRRFINQPALTNTLDNAASMTQSWAAISTDGRKVADKMTTDFLKPVPWYLYPVKKGSELIDIFAAVARHTP